MAEIESERDVVITQDDEEIMEAIEDGNFDGPNMWDNGERDDSGEKSKSTNWMEVIQDNIVEKGRVYVDSPDEVPEDHEVQEGERGGIYYETDDNRTDSQHRDSSVKDIEMSIFEGVEKTPRFQEVIEKLDIELYDPFSYKQGRKKLGHAIEDVYGKRVYYGSGSVDDTESSKQDGIRQCFSTWGAQGYWATGTAPIWFACRLMSGRNAKIPDEAQAKIGDVVEFEDGTIEFTENHVTVEYFEDNNEMIGAITDMIKVHQEYVKRELSDDEGKLTLYRGIRGELLEEAKKSIDSGESLQVNPRAMESWALRREDAEEWGDVVFKKEFDYEEVAFIGEFNEGTKEVTILGKEEYELDPSKNIEVV